MLITPPSRAQLGLQARRRSSQLISSISPRVRWFTFILLLLPVLFLALIRIHSASAEALVSFGTATLYNVGAGPYWTATFTKFGKPAIAVTNQDGNSVSVLYGNLVGGQFNGTFGAATTYDLVAASIPTPAPQQVVVGNLGQLPLPCLVVAAAGADRVAVLLGNSDDSFQPAVYYNVGIFPESVALGDVNGDGNLDIIAANFGSSSISVLLGNSDRTFQSQQTYATSSSPESVVVADFNNDGKIDVATVNSGNPGKVNVLLNVNGTFPNALTSDVGVNPFSLAVGDFNSDGKVDIVTANHGGGVSVLLNNSLRPFPTVAPAPISAGSAPFSVAVADFNLDGQPDIAVSNSDNGGSVGILPNNNGSFQALQVSDRFSSGPDPRFIAAGDFNTDGKPDIVAPNHPSPVVNPGTISVLLNSALPFANPPANDNFISAQNVNSINAISGRLNGTNIGATPEAGEPNHATSDGAFSVWYSWTAPVDGAMTFDTFGSSFDTVLAIYKGNAVNSLTLVHSNDNDRGENGDFRNSSRVSFTGLAGTTYRIAVAGTSGQPVGSITLNWYLSPKPKNDAFSNAQTMTGSSGTVFANNAGSTKEIGEPNHASNAGGASVWYRFVPPIDGSVTINTNGSDVDTLLAVYTGAIGNLTLIAENDDDPLHGGFFKNSVVTFTADHTKTYFIAVDGKNGATDNFVLFWGLGSLPNQSFDQPQQLLGTSGQIIGPSPVGLWYTWTAPSSGGFFFSSSQFRSLSGFGDKASVLTISTGNTENSLTTIGTKTGECTGFGSQTCGPARVDFNAVSGLTYRIFVIGPSFEAIGTFTLSWGPSSGSNTPTPFNNNFADAATLTGFAGSASGTLVGATIEPNEPNHSAQQGGTGGSSVWYNWTPQRDVNVTFRSTGLCLTGIAVTQTATSVGIYTGSNLASLTEVTKAIGNCVPQQPSNPAIETPAAATFNAVQGTTYRISIDRRTSTSSYGLSWDPNSVPLNDNFSSSQPISGESGSVEGYTKFSTSEAEPNHGLSGSFGSVWYTWTAPPTSGLVTFSSVNNGSSNNTVAVYSGNTLQSLSAVVAGNIKFLAIANSTYRIAVAATTGSQGAFTLKWGRPASISGRVKDIRGVGIANIPITLSGTTPRSQSTDALGNYSFVDLIEGGNYTVTPGVASFTFGVRRVDGNFEPVANRSFNPLVGNVTNADFFALTPTYSIAGQIKVNGVGIDNIAVTLTGTEIPPGETVLTTEGGNYSFTNLKTNGDYKITPSSSLHTFSADIFPANNFYEYKTLNMSQKGQDFTGTGLPQTLTVASVNPSSGVGITITPNDNAGLPGGPTPLTRVYGPSTQVTLMAPATAGGNNFQKWLKNGVDFSNNTSTNVTMDANHTMTAVYVTPTRTLTIASNPANGVDITVTPLDNNSQGNGTTQFTRTYNINQKVSLTAIATNGNNTFQKWLKNGADYSTDLATEVTLDADHTMTAVYLTTSAQTPTGQNVSVQLNGVTVSFTTVTSAGTTTIMPINPASAGQLPSGFQLTGNSIAFDITTTAAVQPPISVCFNVPSVTDATLFGQLRILHDENGTLVDRTSSQNFATKMVCATVGSLSPFVLVSTTVQQLELLLEEATTQVTALDALLMLRDPFPVESPDNVLLGADKNTRVVVLVRNLLPGTTAIVHLVDAKGQIHNVEAVDHRPLSGFEFTQVTFRLPDGLAAGPCAIEIRAHGLVSNLGTIRIK